MPGIAPLLQPVAHALLQARDEVNEAMHLFPDHLLWHRPAGCASVAFHLQHLAGVLDRLFTYAHARELGASQLDYLAAEGERKEDIQAGQLLRQFNRQVDMAIRQLEQVDPGTLAETREVGRKKIPSTVIGLLFHAAEHSMRHTGQLLVTIKVLKAG